MFATYPSNKNYFDTPLNVNEGQHNNYRYDYLGRNPSSDVSQMNDSTCEYESL